MARNPSARHWLARAAAAGTLLLAPAVWGQQQPAAGAQQPATGAPQGPAGAAQQSPDTTQQTENAPQTSPGPVGGVEQYRVEGPGLGRSYYIPRLTVQQLDDTNPGYSSTSGGSQSDAVTAITGGLTLQLLKRNSTFSLDYSSEGIIYDTGVEPNAVVQQLGVTEKLTLRRWTLLFAENFSYLPESAFLLGGLGYAGGASAGLAGIGGLTNVNQYLQQTQTIASPKVKQLSSSSAFQAQYNLGAGSSLSGSVVAGFLHFFGTSLLDSRDIYGRFEYDRALTRRDTLTFSYSVTRLDYSSSAPGFTTHSFQVGYRRLLTGRLNLSVLAGPTISHFPTATGQTMVPGGANLVNWFVSGNLGYLTRRGGITVQYSHGIAGGSGFFVGTEADQVSATLSRRFSRAWSGSINGGFAHNSSLQQTTPGTTSLGSLVFNDWFAGATLSRTVRRYSTLSFIYNAQRQTGNTTTCVMGLACGPVALTQVVGITFNWSTRPLKLE